MNILCLSDSLVNDPFNGGSLRIWNLLDRGNADVFYFKDHKSNCREKTKTLTWKSLAPLECDLGKGSVLRDRQKLQIRKTDIFPGNFLRRNQDRSQIVKNILEEYLNNYPQTSIVVFGHKMGLLLSKLIPGKFIFDGCDSMSLYYHRRSRALSNKQWQQKINSQYMSAVYGAIESYIARHAALYLVPAKADRYWIETTCPQANVIDVGNGTEWINLPSIENIESETIPTIAFHGGMTWEPNRSAAMYLIREIFPKVRAVIPHVKLKIAGAPVFEELSACQDLDGIEICGFVDDIRQWLTECDVYVMPMLQGSGVKNKLIEVMAAGLPIVTNSLGAEALSQEARDSIIVSEGAKAIANAIITLLQNPEARRSLGKKARTVAEKSFCWQTLSQKLMTEIELANCTVTR